jgi:hypothetical protein
VITAPWVDAGYKRHEKLKEFRAIADNRIASSDFKVLLTMLGFADKYDNVRLNFQCRCVHMKEYGLLAQAWVRYT